MKIIAFINQKGGVGKTCATLNLGAGLAKYGKKVLMIDLDPQSSLTECLISYEQTQKGNIYTLLTEPNQKIQNIVIKIKADYDFVPSHIQACGLEYSLPAKQEFRILEEKLEEIKKDYDFILLDCPPGLGAILINALITATGLYLCTTPEPKSILGLANLQDTIAKTNKTFKSKSEITGVIVGQYDPRRTLTKKVMEVLDTSFSKKMFQTKIRRNVDLAEAVLKKEDIFRYAPNSNGAKDFESLTKEVLNRG